MIPQAASMIADVAGSVATAAATGLKRDVMSLRLQIVTSPLQLGAPAVELHLVKPLRPDRRIPFQRRD